MTTIQETLNALDEVKKAINDAYEYGYSNGRQRIWVGLTDEEANKIYKDGSTFGEMMRMVEAKLRSKNEDRN